MKFGGTSVADAVAMNRTISIVQGKLNQKPIVVVSACAKVTDSLYDIISLIESGRKEDAEKSVGALRNRHLGIVKDITESCENNDEQALAQVTEKVNGLCDRVASFIGAGSLANAEKALVISTGEYLSSTIIAYAMNLRGINTCWIDARRMLITSGDNLKAAPVIDKMSKRADEVIKESYIGHQAGITQGFITCNEDGEPALLGRGGSDYSASLFGMAVDADRIEIWTDVDGVRTADPRIVEGTKGIRKLSYEESAELARFGAKVLHPLTLAPAQSKNIPLYVLNSMNPGGEGTVVLNSSCIFDGVKSIAYNGNIRLINIYSLNMIATSGFLATVFEIFSRHKVVIDMIVSAEASITVTVEASQDISAAVEEISKIAKVTVDRDKAQISVIGKNIVGLKGVLRTIFDSVNENKIYMISQGASFMNISFVVDRPELSDVLCSIHKGFFGDENSN